MHLTVRHITKTMVGDLKNRYLVTDFTGPAVAGEVIPEGKLWTSNNKNLAGIIKDLLAAGVEVIPLTNAGKKILAELRK